MTRLVLAADADFAWLAGEGPSPTGFTQAAGGVEAPNVLRWLRRTTARLLARGCVASWLILDGDCVVGLCSFKRPPDADGGAEIGYGVGESRRGRGHATAAVRLMIEEVVRTGSAGVLRAETAVDNLASQQVLVRNGFKRVGARSDPEDGELVLWSRPVQTA